MDLSEPGAGLDYGVVDVNAPFTKAERLQQLSEIDKVGMCRSANSRRSELHIHRQTANKLLPPTTGHCIPSRKSWAGHRLPETQT